METTLENQFSEILKKLDHIDGIVNRLDSIDSRLDIFEERLAKIEKKDFVLSSLLLEQFQNTKADSFGQSDMSLFRSQVISRGDSVSHSDFVIKPTTKDYF